MDNEGLHFVSFQCASLVLFLLYSHLKPCTSFLEQRKLQCCLLVALLKVDRPAEELEVAHDVLVVHDHLAGRQQPDLPVVVLEAATAKCSGIPQSLKK